MKKNKIFYKIISSSMMPSLNIGEIVICGEKKPEDIEVGDIVVVNKDFFLRNDRDLMFFSQFKDDDFSIIHRVIHKEKKDGHYYFKTKGDNNSRVDGHSQILEQTEDYILVEYDSKGLLIPESEIMGVVLAKTRRFCPKCGNMILDRDLKVNENNQNNDNNKSKYSNFDLGKFKKVELKFYLNKERNNGKDETI